MASNPSSKRLPAELTELIDTAVFSFAAISGLRSKHKVRGNPVIDGVVLMFGRLLECSKENTKQLFQQVSAARLGGWQPGQEATKELHTFVSSRLKQAKEKQEIRERDEPHAPDTVIKKDHHFDEEKDRVITKRYPKCWRCKKKCRYCREIAAKNIGSSLKAE